MFERKKNIHVQKGKQKTSFKIIERKKVEQTSDVEIDIIVSE